MSLVGEAAKKLDRYTALFHKQRGKSATESQEYKRLQQFYQSRLAHQIDDSILGKWILALAQQTAPKVLPKLIGPEQQPSQLEHVYVDLEAVKKDLEYELFFVRKSNGTRFFHPRLLRNLKLTCDFANRGEGNDLLIDLSLWQDRYFQGAALEILHAVKVRLDQFYKRALKCKESELVMMINKAIMSLMLASYPENRIKDLPGKSCKDYFIDFLGFLTELLTSHDYHKIITYPPKQAGEWRFVLLSLSHALCRSLYTNVHRFQAFLPELQQLILHAHHDKEAKNQTKTNSKADISEGMAKDYSAMSKIVKRHPSGSMGKILDAIDRGTRSFDPVSQGNIPNYLFTITVGERRISNLHIPTPTVQEYINKVSVLDQFRSFLRSYAETYPHGKHLLINLQDRTAWREHQRCSALEGLLTHGDFQSTLTVTTLAKETEFYEQLPPYDKEHEASLFIHHFLDQLEGESSGYFFMPMHRNEIIHDFAPKAMKLIHKVFFGGRNILPQTSRLDFIEIFDLFLILKIIDCVRPDSISLTCKDGVDTSSGCNILLYSLIKMIQGDPITAADREYITMQLFAPAILIRERLMVQNRFQRTLSAIKAIELVYNDLGAQKFSDTIRAEFSLLYKGPILQASCK
jgi:hypothetical protein